MSGDGSSVTKKVRPGTLDIDTDECLLIVNCFIETTVLQDGEPVSRDRKPQQKCIPLDLPRSHDDCIMMAEDLVRSSKYILKAQQPQVEQLLYQLYQRGLTAPKGYAAAKDDGEIARMENLETYLEMLYDHQEDMSEKIKGTAMILQLTHQVGNLEILVQDHPLMGALSRVLNDDFRKSIEVTYNILRIFLAFSNFVEMHDILANYRVGNVTMKVLDMELKKAELRDEERKKRFTDEGAQGATGAGGIRDSGGSVSSMKDVGDSKSLLSSKEEAKARILAKKQDKVLFVCLYVLLNLASDANVEKKMIKKKLTDYLIAFLDRISYDLLLLVVTFLKKLSVYEENIEQMREANIISKLVKFIPCSHDRLTDLTLRLLFNLSFDAGLRDQMVKNSLIPKLVDLLKKPPFRAKTLKLLYQISVDDKCKSMFTYTEAIPLIKELILNFPRNMLTQELGALAINLTWNDRNAEMLSQKGGLKRIMERMIDKKDPLLMKVVRNISNWSLMNQFELNDPQHEYRLRSMWPSQIKPLISMMLETDNNDVLVEVVGTLANLTPLDLPLGTSWEVFIQDYDLLSFCKRLLVPGMAQTDIILEVIILVGAFALDPSAAEELANSHIVRAVHDVWTDKNDDAEVVLQSLFTFYRLLRHAETRDSMLYLDYKDKKGGVQQTRIVLDIIAALSHRNLEIRMAADMCMDLIMETDRGDDGILRDCGIKIRQKRYEAYNMEWCDLLQQEEQMMKKEGYPYGNAMTTASLVSSIMSPTSAEITRRSSGNMYFRGEKLAMNMHDLGGTPNFRGGTPDEYYDDEEDEDEEDHMIDADRKYSMVQSPGGNRGSTSSLQDWGAEAKSPIY